MQQGAGDGVGRSTLRGQKGKAAQTASTAIASTPFFHSHAEKSPALQANARRIFTRPAYARQSPDIAGHDRFPRPG
jgi:hypothetical protein